MPIKFIYRRTELELEGTLTVREALEKLNLPVESHLVVRDGQLLNEQEALRNGDVVKIIPAISGGQD